MTTELHHPTRQRTAVAAAIDGVAVVMPAYGEEANLAATVTDFLDTLDDARIPHAVVVVNDGSTDRTGDVLDSLARRYPGRVVAVHHDRNRGYGAAVRSGLDAALRHTELGQILLTDSDRQFHAADLLELRRRKATERADAILGYRERRADPWHRRLNARVWTLLCKTLLRLPGRDVDCAYKLIDRRLLEELSLTGEAAAISPELVSRITVDGNRVVEHPVRHYPRTHGEQTGARLSVVARSLLSLAGVYARLVRDAHRLVWLRRLARPANPTAAVVTILAALLAAAAYVFYLDQGVLLAYKDANSHLLIARRVVASPTAGLAQLGGVWLPLPHLLSAPLAAWESWYLNGFAGALISMISFVLCVRYLYLLGETLTRTRLGGLVTAALFAGNANILYLQATAMTELPLFACLAAATYHLDQWCRAARSRDLAAASVAVLAATLTRYEGWVFCAAALVIVIYVELRRHRSYSRTESSLVIFGFLACAGIAAWLVWNLVIFADPLYWQRGEYAESSLWVDGNDVNVGELDIASGTYGLATYHNIGLVTLAIAAAGMLLYLIRHRIRREWVAIYPLLGFGPFFVVALYTGQRPLNVVEYTGHFYNVRFGLIMLLPAAVFAGYLISVGVSAVRRFRFRSLRWTAVAVAVLVTAFGIATVPGVVTLRDAVEFRETDWENAATARWLRDNHDGDLTLMMSFANESVTYDSRIPTESLVYEGTYRLWERALADPHAQGIEWIYMRALPDAEDLVWHALYDTPQLEDHYTLVYEFHDRLVFRSTKALTEESEGEDD
ncbi:glycosyltransferase [Stackebrandtia nassauensis]|uniref:Glycosyl transferase family 2 n=1 Tax=Stackebrandtia nassauensis (strain DSM 44728 / CIP 108903 / NRRL B-16338 / NBRC 102104 / LLR-40K-21) TaxID=446470 RepID=D3Q9F6_STANL|nr:glycosyltransferase [Stackebrandtia nassauensis]ADD42638.1 glycosyl transferase family 2 [Stackebrandtia nassauensis DSM 44728]